MKNNIIALICLTIITVPSFAETHTGEGVASQGRQCDIVTSELLQQSKDLELKDIDSLPVKDTFTVWDHVGFKDEAWSGKQHVYLSKQGGVIFQGYAQKPYNDLIVTKKMNDNSVVRLGQVPLRADWHTLNGNGLIFGAEISEGKLSGYSVVATISMIEVREYKGVSKESFMDGTAEFEVLAAKAKICPAQEFVVDNKKVYESGELLFDLSTKEYYGEYVGAVTDFAEHNCGSLSTIYVPYCIVDGTNIFSATDNEVTELK